MINDPYITSVRAALWGTEQIETPVTDELMALHMRQGTGALVFPALLEREDLSPYARAQMKGACLRAYQQQTRLQHTLTMAWVALEKAGIHAVLMKGAGLASLYPSPEQREWGDIDLFVGKEQYHPACAVMRDTFPHALKFDEELDHYKHYNLIADGISIEVHRVSVGLQHPLDEYRYASIEGEGMGHAISLKLNGLEVRVPEPTFNALFVCLHAWEHMMTNGANLRQICDHALLLHHYASKIDRPRLQHYLRALHMMDVWRLFMAIEVCYLGLPENEAPYYTPSVQPRAERLTEDLLRGALRVPESQIRTAANRFVRKWHTMQERIANASRIGQYSPAYARHLKISTWLHGAVRLLAKDRRWE